MLMKEFVRRYVERQKVQLHPGWLDEVNRIVVGGSSMDSASKRAVTRDAVKAQRKKIFKRMEVKNSHELLVKMLQHAVKSLPNE